MQVELGRLVLKRFLLLVLLLDKAVLGAPERAPLLFRRGQPLKSSAEVCASDMTCVSDHPHASLGPAATRLIALARTYVSFSVEDHGVQE